MAESTNLSQSVGKVFILTGDVKAISADGVERGLAINSYVYPNERIMTGNDGIVSIILNGPGQNQLDLGRLSSVNLDQDFTETQPAADVTEDTSQAHQIQDAIEAGNFNPETDLPKPAAGADGQASAGGGIVRTVFDLEGMEVKPTSGLVTTGPESSFFDPQSKVPDGLPDILDISFLDTTGGVVDETDGLNSTVTGEITFSFGPDGAGYIRLEANDATWNGTDTLYADNGSWKIELTQASEGVYQYTFEQLSPIDHPVSGNIPETHDDPLNFEISVIVADRDGDIAADTFTINVEDDGPSLANSVTAVVATGNTVYVPGQEEISYFFYGTSDDVIVNYEIFAQEDNSFFLTYGTPLQVTEQFSWTYAYVNVGETTIDHWGFEHLGGPFSIDLLSERGTVDIGSPGQDPMDAVIYLFKDNNGNGIIDPDDPRVGYNDDNYYSNPEGWSDGSQSSLDSYLSIEDLNAGNYILAVGDYYLSESEAREGRQYGDETGTYQITFNGTNLLITSPPSTGTPSSVSHTQFTVDESNYATGDLEGDDSFASVTASLNFEYGIDGPGSLALSAYGTTWNDVTSALEARNGTWQIVLDQDSGSYTFYQLAAMDHEISGDGREGEQPGGHNEPIKLAVTAIITDNDGDTAETFFEINVLDDGPSISNQLTTVVAIGNTVFMPWQAAPRYYSYGHTTVDHWGVEHVGGPLSINLLSERGTVDIGTPGQDPMNTAIYLFKDNNGNGIIDSDDIRVGYNNDYRSYDGRSDGSLSSLDSYLSFENLDAGNYILAVGDYYLSESEARAGQQDGDDTGAYQITFKSSSLVITSSPSSGTPSSITTKNDVTDIEFTVDESNYGSGDLEGDGSFESFGGILNLDYGLDGPGFLALSADGATWNNVTSTLEAANGTWEILLDQDTGNYTFNQLAAMGHAASSDSGEGAKQDGHNDPINLVIKATITDSDGSSAETSFGITVLDDGPSIYEISNAEVDETDGFGSVNGYLYYNYGVDQGGFVALNAENAEWNARTNTLTAVDGTYEVVLSGSQYTFTQLAAIDHSSPDNSNEAISLNFTAIVTDGDGSSVSDNFAVSVLDDGPSIDEISNVEVDESDGLDSVSGYIDFNYGADQGGAVALAADNAEWNAETNTLTAVDGTYEVVLLGSQYTFTQRAAMDYSSPYSSNEDIRLNFTATVVDGDGDTVIGNFTVTALADGPTISNASTTVVAIGNTVNLPSQVGFPYYSYGYTTVDHWGFEHNGGPLSVDLLSERGTVDIGPPGQDPMDTMVFLFKDNNGNGIVDPEDRRIGYNDDNYYSNPDGWSDGSQSSLDSYLSIDNLDAGSYILAVGDYYFNESHAKEGKQYGNDTGTYQITFKGTNLVITSHPASSGPLGSTTTIETYAQFTVDESNYVTSASEGEDSFENLTGKLNIDYGADGPGSLALAADDAIWNDAASTLEATNGTWQIVLDQETGSYTFNQLAAINHEVRGDGGEGEYQGGHNDPVSLAITATITDNDGDSAETYFGINILDDGPSIYANSNRVVDETDGLDSVSGYLYLNYGADQGGSVALAADNAEWNAETNTLTAVDGTYEVVLSGSQYTFTQLAAIGHSSFDNPNDAIRLNFTATVTDGDGDTANDNFTVTVLDDGPSISNTVTTVVVIGNTIYVPDEVELPYYPYIFTGYTTVDHWGFEHMGGPLSVDLLSEIGTVDIGAPGQDPMDTMVYLFNDINGNAIIDPDDTRIGYNDNSYLYPDGGSDGSQSFFDSYLSIEELDAGNYILAVGDCRIYESYAREGKQPGNDTGAYQITFKGTNLVVTSHPASGAISSTTTEANGADIPLAVDESNYSSGENEDDGSFESIAGNFELDYGADGPGSLVLSADGATWNDATSTLEAANGTWEIVCEGSQYTFRQLAAMDHPDPDSPNDAINLYFTATVTDGDGDTVNGYHWVTVYDDGPVSVDDSNVATFDGAEGTADGNVLDNDISGVDGFTVTSIEGQFVDQLPDSDPTEIVGDLGGILTIDSEGDYSYLIDGGLIPAGKIVIETFEYEVTDGDGDMDTASLSIESLIEQLV